MDFTEMAHDARRELEHEREKLTDKIGLLNVIEKKIVNKK